MKWNILVLSCSLLFTSQVFALDAEEPTKCPSVSAILTTGIDDAHEMGDGNWIAGKLSANYGTEQNWSFGIPYIKAADVSEAVKTGKELIPALVFKQGPLPTPPNYGKRWVCIYEVAPGQNAYAVTPGLGVR